MKALVGHTGFVGSNLLRQAAFDVCFNSKNIEDIRGCRFDVLVCCGAPAEKWKANQFPDEDKKNIESLMACLAQAKVDRFILISTVDVFAAPRKVDENSPIDASRLQPYGRHRRELEEFAKNTFKTTIVRLPGLFGKGLKKNAIFDLLNKNQLEKIHPGCYFQFYNVHRLWADLEEALRNSLDLVHFATEPLAISHVAWEIFNTTLTGAAAPPPALYDVRSRHAGLFGGADGYLYNAAQVTDDLRRFVEQERKSA